MQKQDYRNNNSFIVLGEKAPKRVKKSSLIPYYLILDSFKTF